MARRGSSDITGEIISFEPLGVCGKLKPEEIELQFEKEDGTVITNIGPKFGKRHMQNFGMFLMFFINQTMRQHISLTIVAMTDPTANTDKTIPTFDWTNKNVILSSFFWGYIGPQILAGWIITRYGPKYYLIGATALTALTGFLIPWLAIHFGAIPLIVCRVFQGVSQCFVVPSLSYFSSRWIPVGERARSSTLISSGTSVATIVSMAVSGRIAASRFGWPMVFYFFSFLGLVWCVYYYFSGYDSPVDHKSITEEEKLYIIRNAVDPSKKQQPTPWGKIFTSVPFFALLYSFTACILINWIFLTQIPTYMSKIMKFNIKDNGLLTSLIYLTQWIISVIMSFICDYLTNKNYLSTTAVRKIFIAIGSAGPAVALLFLAECTEENPVRGVVLLMLAVGASGANNSCIYINNLDIAPDHAGVVQAILNSFAHIFAVLAPLSVQFLVDDETDADQWKKVFYMSSAAGFSSAIIFAILGTAKKQSWNNLEGSEDERNEEKKMTT